MDIHIVIAGETIESIAEKYGVSAKKIILDNGVNDLDKLVPGQTIVIIYPQIIYIVQDGDTLQNIADTNGISMIQLLRNNPFLTERDYIYPGETLVISYNNTMGKVSTCGFAYPYINRKTLLKTLPYLTYLSIFNYTVTKEGELITNYDDTELIQISKDYGVAPLMLITTLTPKGEPNIETTYDILSNEELQEQYINTVIDLIKSKGYYGANLSFQYLNITNQNQYTSLLKKVSEKAHSEGIPLFITINPNKAYVGNELVYEKVDFSAINQEANSIAFITFNWAYNFGPPIPIGSIQDIKDLIDYVANFVVPEKILVGLPVLGYNWELPYVVGFSKATALSLDSVINLARDIGAVIEFDELSQTPYIRYAEPPLGIQHIIWFIDARSVNSLMNLVSSNRLQGTGIWNVMEYYSQMWLVINSQYEIENVL